MKRTIEFEFIRDIEIFTEHGFETNIGGFSDKDFNSKNSSKGYKFSVKRRVALVDGKFFYTGEVRDPNESVWKRILRIEGKGHFRDDKLPNYPFDEDDSIMISLEFIEANKVLINLKLIDIPNRKA